MNQSIFSVNLILCYFITFTVCLVWARNFLKCFMLNKKFLSGLFVALSCTDMPNSRVLYHIAGLKK